MKKLHTLFSVLLCLSMVTYASGQMPSGTAMWLRADQNITTTGDRVNEWLSSDVSGTTAVGATGASQPSLIPSAINGKPAVRFSGAQLLYCSSVYPVARDYTLLYVVKLTNLGATNNIVSGNSHATYTNPTKLLHGDFSTQATAPTALTTSPALITVRFNQSSQNGVISVNGLSGDSAFVGTNTDSVMYIGAYAGANFMVGDVGEVVLFNRALSAADLKKAEDYMLQKFGIARVVPAPVDTTFSAIPQSKQFYARDENNGADILVRGYVVAPNADSAVLLLYRDQLLIERTSQKLTYANGSAPFQLHTRIKSELREYRIEVLTINNGVSSVLAVRDSIVCGDVYLIAGQSNTVFGGVSNALEFVRTYGGTASANKGDTLFSMANATGGSSNIGAFGMRVAELIMQNHAVPVCIINGGVGGTTIEQNSRVDNQPELLTSIYGSMLYRVRKSKFTDKAKALFWYQGESNQVTNYAKNFRKLHTDWLRDYPSLQKVYMVQIRPGCASFATHDLLRDVQRAMQDSLPKLEVMAAVALPGHDGCHYTSVGYTALGNNLYRLVDRDFYNSTDTVAVSAPSINRAYFSGTDRRQLALVFKPSKSNLIPQQGVTVGGVGQLLKDHIYLDGGVKISSIQASADTLFLNLAGTSNALRVSYTPAVHYNGTSTIYQGPWIVNTRGIGALTFANFPITDKLSTDVPIGPSFSALRSVIVSPNPASTDATIQLPQSGLAVKSIEVVGSIGTVYSIPLTNQNDNQVSFSTQSLPTGTYMVRVITEDTILNGSVTIVR